MHKKALGDYTCYLFDADGTLMDTTELIYRTYSRTIRQVTGREVPRETIIKDIGKPLPATLRKLLPELPPAEFERIMREHVAYQFSIRDDYLRPFPGVAGTLQKLTTRGKRLAVVTSRTRETVVPYLKSLGLLDFFPVLVTPEDTAKHKPEPEPVIEALRQLQAKAADSLFIGDSIYDMQCAAAAGTDTCFVLWSDTPLAALPAAPVHTIKNMTELPA